MEMNDYQLLALTTAQYESAYLVKGDSLQEMGFIYPALGLVGEAGEVAEKCKKILRDDGGIVSTEKREEVKKELGDVLWYLAVLANEFDIPMEEVAMGNLNKLSSRQVRGVISGSGDNR